VPRVPALSRATVDRASLSRHDEDWLAATWDDPRTSVLVLRGMSVPVHDGRLVAVAPAEAPAGLRIFLGLEDGRACWAVVAEGRAPPGDVGLREAGAVLGDRDAGLLVHAVAVARWHSEHRYCPRCGAPTEPERGASVRRCTAEGTEQFPRVDPAVIMLVHDGADRCVLGRQHGWPPRRYSTLAGFVEPGESLEQAVAREVGEEAGLDAGDIRYVASQPWPFPRSLMVAFTARALDPDAPLDPDVTEMQDVRWFSRDQVAAAVGGSDDGPLLLPPSVSVARLLLERWVAGG